MGGGVLAALGATPELNMGTVPFVLIPLLLAVLLIDPLLYDIVLLAILC